MPSKQRRPRMGIRPVRRPFSGAKTWGSRMPRQVAQQKDLQATKRR